MKADSNSWKQEPFTAGVAIPVQIEIGSGEFSFIENGLIPQEMEDKWFMYFEKPFLFVHRSWTGQPVYRIEFEESRDVKVYRVNQALLAEELAENGGLEYQGKLATFLVSNLLLGRNLPFPMPDNLVEPMPGVLQHHISGTGYPETGGKINKPWWKRW